MLRYVSSNSEIGDFNSWLEGRRFFTIDLETGPAEAFRDPESIQGAGLDPYRGMIVLILVGDEDDQWVLDVRAGLDLSRLRVAVESTEVTKAGVNLRFDCKFLMLHYGWRPAHLYDCQIAEQVIRAGVFSTDDKAPPGQIRKMTSMASLVKFYFGQDIDKDVALRTGFWKTPVGQFGERQLAYAAGDIVWPLRIARAQAPIAKERELVKVLRTEFALIPVLADMEVAGMYLDTDAWLELYQQSVAKVAAAERQMDEVFGLKTFAQDDLFGESETVRRINYGSSSQVARLLERAGVKGFVDENGNTLSTESREILIGKLRGDIPACIADPLLDFRRYDQRRKSYGLNFLKSVHPVTGRIHPDVTQMCLVTGRISCSPGVQTIPRDPAFRAAFKGRRGYVLSVADASQIEARIIADMTGDPEAVKVFQQNGDIYKHDGELFYGVTIDKTTLEGKALRNHAKVSWLGLNYGQGKDKFHLFCIVNLGHWIDKKDTDFLYDKFFEIHPVMRDVMDEWSAHGDPERPDCWFSDELAAQLIKPSAEQYLYERMLRQSRGNKEEAAKRTRRLMAFKDRVHYSEGYAGRKRFHRVDYLSWYNASRNAPVQMGAAQIQKESMIELAHFIWDEGYDAHIINAVHDEIIIEVREDQIEDFYPHHVRIMNEVGQRYLQNVPMKTEGGWAREWKKY